MPQSGETIVNSIAVFILAGMMLLPLVNLFVGAIVGAGVSGAVGLFAGALLAFLIMAVEVALLRARDQQLAADAARTQPRALIPSGNLSRAIVSLAEWRHRRLGLAIARGRSLGDQQPSQEDRRQAA
jgi:hypothetical protein